MHRNFWNDHYTIRKLWCGTRDKHIRDQSKQIFLRTWESVFRHSRILVINSRKWQSLITWWTNSWSTTRTTVPLANVGPATSTELMIRATGWSLHRERRQNSPTVCSSARIISSDVLLTGCHQKTVMWPWITPDGHILRAATSRGSRVFHFAICYQVYFASSAFGIWSQLMRLCNWSPTYSLPLSLCAMWKENKGREKKKLLA